MSRASSVARCPRRERSDRLPVNALRSAIALSIALTAAQSLKAQTVQSDAEPQAKSLDSVVILGTRRSDVTALTSAQPIDVVNAQALQATGANTISEALQRSVPSFHFPQETPSTSVQYAVRGASLHGMAPDQVLILVNGQRYHRNSQLNTGYLGYGRGTQVVDIDSIPVSAIERVEVLRDGASAQYGSDAISGVINIVLKKETGAGGVSATVGQFSKGDGFRREVEADYGFKLPNDGFLHLGAVLGRTDPSDIAIDDTRQYYFTGDPRESTVNRHWFYGSGEVKKAAFSFNGEIPINDTVTAYADGVLAYRKNYGFGTFRLPKDNNNVRAIYPDGFEPKQSVTSKDADVSTGIRVADPDGWGNFDFNAQIGRNRSDINLWDTLNSSLGVDSPTSGSAGATINTDLNLSVNHTKYIAPDFMPGITIGDGLSYRHERYEIVSGDPWTYIDGGVPVLDGPSAGTTTQQGSQSGSGFNANDAGVWTRHVVGAYLSATTTLFDRLDLDLSGRVEDYSDFGNTTTGKLSARFEFTPSFSIRGSLSTGFRAPSIAQLYYTRTSGTIVSNEQKIVRILPASSAAAQALGAEPLKPEKSNNASLGLVWQPTRNSVFTLDGYDIRVDDRIILTGTLSGTYASNVLAAAGYGELYGAQFFTNALDTRTRGFDAVYRYQLPHLSIGDLDFTLSYSVNHTRITHQDDTPAVLAAAGLSLVDRQQKAFIEHGTPDTKLVASATYSVGRWSFNPAVVRYGEYAYYDTKSATLDQTFGKQWVANLAVNYRVSRHWDATLGADNLFDSHPDKQIVAERSPSVSEYSNLAPEGANGTWLYARVNYKF